MPPKQRKIAIMGYRSVGKSSLSIQFVEGQFVDSYDPTIENTFTKSTRVNSQDYELKLVDTAGQDEYSIFPTQYSMDIHGYVLVYSITSAKSFEIVQIIYDKLLDITGKLHVPIVLVGNKTDLYVDRMITTDQGKRLASSWNAAFLETSAKQNEIFFTPCLWKLKRPMETYKKGQTAVFVELPGLKILTNKCKCVKPGRNIGIIFWYLCNPAETNTKKVSKA